MFLLPTMISACNSSSLAFLMMCSVYRSNRQGDSRQLCCTLFSIVNQSVVPAVQFTLVTQCVQLFATLWTAACQASLSITNSWSLLKLMSIELVMPSSHLILCHPLLLMLSIFPSIRVFSSESVLCIRWPKYWSFSNRPSNEYSGLISFKIDWFDPFAVQGTLKSLLQHHSSKASIFNENRFQQKPHGSYRILIVASWPVYSRIAWCGGLVTKSKLATPWTSQDPLSMGFSRQEHWSGLPFSSPRDLPNPGIEAGLLNYRRILYQMSYQDIPPNQWTCAKL